MQDDSAGVPSEGPDEQERPQPPQDVVRIATVICGRCGWPNGCRVQQGMRALRFMCQWCGRMTTGIVDPTLKRNVIF
jgi:hypothetical protein